jgi:hypothetical protein
MLQFENTTVDLGVFPKSTVIHFEVPGKSISDKELDLEIKPSCGCTSVSNIKVKPQSAFKIKGTISGRSMSGEKKISVRQPEVHVITLKYTIK